MCRENDTCLSKAVSHPLMLTIYGQYQIKVLIYLSNDKFIIASSDIVVRNHSSICDVIPLNIPSIRELVGVAAPRWKPSISILDDVLVR